MLHAAMLRIVTRYTPQCYALLHVTHRSVTHGYMLHTTVLRMVMCNRLLKQQKTVATTAKSLYIPIYFINVGVASLANLQN